MKKLLLFCSIMLLALACQDHSGDPAPDTCKLSTSPSVKSLTYDNNGRVATLTTESYNGTDLALVLSTFSYDAAGKLDKTVYTVKGALNSEETYTYTDGRITQVSFSGPNSPTGINRLSYDAAGRLTRYTVEIGGSLEYAQTYAYNADGVMTAQTVVNAQENVLYRIVVRPTGNVKSPEQLLLKRGLPYLIPTGMPWSLAEGGVGTVTEYYSPDQSGKLALAGSSTVSAVKTNASGYLTEYTLTDASGANAVTQRYTLLDCD